MCKPLAIALLSALALGLSARPLSMTVDASQTGPPISPYMYGFFTEELANWYQDGLWAEMLGDRKFFYPINSSPRQTPPNSRKFVERWRPIGPDQFVAMDRGHVWVGAHSPRVALDPSIPHGIQQSGLGLVQGKKYTGRIILSADPRAVVTVSLVSGPNSSERQTIPIKEISQNYRKFPLQFTAGASTLDGRIEIAATGYGSFHIGAVSLMPADNIDGFRADMIAELKKIGPTIFRWPGGNFTSGYNWRDGIGDPDKRSPRYDHAWNALVSNDVGIDEFMELTKILGIAPYICVNAGFGDAHSAAEEVQYFNGAADTPMGKLRAANGHPQPYGVKWWNVGNEMYGPWQLGHMALSQYTIKQNRFADEMRRVDPNIKLVASGATVNEMSTTGAARAITGKAVAQYGGPADWDGGLLAHSAGHFDAIAEHLYPKATQYFDVKLQKFVPANDSLVDEARRLPNRVRCAVEAWQVYQNRFPFLNMKAIPIALDEWVPGRLGPGRNRATMFNALSSAEALQELFRHSALFVMSEYTGGMSLLSYNKVAANIRPVGLMFEMYRRHFGTIPLAVTGNSPQHDVKGAIGVDKPKVSSGSPTYPLDVSAAFTADRKTLTLAIVNPTETAQQIDVAFKGTTLGPQGKLWRIAAKGLNPRNEPGKPRQVNIAASDVGAAPSHLAVPKLSVSIYNFPVE